MNPLRLIHLIDNLRLAGTQNVLRHLTEGFAARGYEQRIYCLTARAHPDNLAALRRAGAEVILLSKAQMFTGPGLLRLYRDFRRWQPDIVQTLLPASDLFGRTAARLARGFASIPHIVTSIQARNADKRPLHLWLDRLTMPWAERVIFNTQPAIEFALAHEGVRPSQVVLIPNGVPIPPEKTRDPQGARTLLGISVPPGAHLIGNVGRLTPQKGQIHLIRAFARLREHVPNIELVIIGSGPLQMELAAEAERLGVAAHVHLPGERENVIGLLAAFDVYAHPSLFEGMPIAVMEAMAAGLPVVATGVDGTRELITDGETGWLVAVGAEAALAERLRWMLENSEAARRVGEAARRHMQENFSIEKMVELWDAVLRELMA